MSNRSAIKLAVICAMLSLLTACAAPQGSLADTRALVDRVTWGVNATSMQQASELGPQRYLEYQLQPGPQQLPQAVQAQIAAMTIAQQPLDQLVQTLEQRRVQIDAILDADEKKAAQQLLQQEPDRLAREAATRSLLRDLYSPAQLQEQMVWFWMNHFSVYQGKSNLRVMVGDYEEQAIRPHALGKFRALLGATLHHPAMLRYLDNDQNAVGRINENYARELIELHTLGADGGYAQRD